MLFRSLNSPCPRPPLAPGQLADPTSLKRGEDYPDEWAKRQAKLAKEANEAVRKFNEDSATAAAASKPRKSMQKKPACKPSSSPMPSRPSSLMPSRPIPQATSVPQVAKPSAPPAKSSAPVHLASCQKTTSISIASGASASSSAAPKSSAGPSLLKKKATAGRGL